MKKFLIAILLVFNIISFGNILSSPANSNVNATTLRQTSFPKSLRGKWHSSHSNLKITANTITGTNFGNHKHTKVYKGSAKLNSKVRPSYSKIFLWKQYGYYYFSLFGSQPAKIKLISKNTLQVYLGTSPTYYHK